MILNRLQELLEKEEFECSFIPGTKDLPFDRLVVFLSFDDQERERILEIVAHEQQVSPEFTLPSAVTLPYRLQFRVNLPFKIEDLALNQVASLVLFLNQYLDLPGFDLNELEGQVSYRYVWIISPDAVDRLLLLSILGSITLNLGIFSDTIETLANGQISFNDLLSQMIQMVDHSSQPKKDT